jgi:predicted nucleic acid-binding protein
MTYCDSSFLAALYISTDVFHQAARREAAKFSHAIPFTLLNELELLNALQRGVGDGALDLTERDAVLREIEADEADALLQRAALNQIKLYDKARELSRKYTPKLACRSLDILHVASALNIGSDKFASFDIRQRKLADAVHLSILPVNLPKPRA